MRAVVIQPLCGPLETGTLETAIKYANAQLLAVSWVTKSLSLTQEACVFGRAFMKRLASKQCKLSDPSQYLTAGGKFC